MKKLNLLAIMILIVTFGTITNVKAEDNLGNQRVSITSFGLSQSDLIKWYSGSGTTTNDFIGTNDLDLNKYDYVLGTYRTLTTNNYEVYTTDLDIGTICDLTTYYSSSGTITYADNTQSDIAMTRVSAYCDGGYISTGELEFRQYNIDTKPNVSVYIINEWYVDYPCEVNDNNFICYIPKPYKVKGFRIKTNYNGFGLTHSLQLDNTLIGFVGDTQAIINNQNQNAQQQHQDNQNINNSIQDTNNTLKDSSIDNNNTSSSTSEWNNKVASNGTITNLLTLPIQLMQGYVNGMNSTCTPFNLGNLFGTNIILPCINVGDLIGSSLWGVIDVLFSGFMIFGIAKKLIKIFNDFTNMKSNQVDELYGGGA